MSSRKRSGVEGKYDHYICSYPDEAGSYPPYYCDSRAIQLALDSLMLTERGAARRALDRGEVISDATGFRYVRSDYAKFLRNI